MLLRHRIVMVMFMAFLCNHAVAWAETLYITDQLIVSLRELPQDNAKPISYLKTDTPVELLEVGKEYSKVKTADGETGYIQKSYLTASSPKTLTITRLTQENQTLHDRIRELEQRYSEAFSKGDEAQKKMISDLQESRGQVDKLQKDLDESNTALAEITKAHQSLTENAKDVIAISEERNQLKLSHEALSTTVTNLEKERKDLVKKETIQWFLAGAGVLLLGWVLGKFSKSRRKSSLY